MAKINVIFEPPLNNRSPLGDTAMARTHSEWPLSVLEQYPVLVSHILML